MYIIIFFWSNLYIIYTCTHYKRPNAQNLCKCRLSQPRPHPHPHGTACLCFHTTPGFPGSFSLCPSIVPQRGSWASLCGAILGQWWTPTTNRIAPTLSGLAPVSIIAWSSGQPFGPFAHYAFITIDTMYLQ